LGHPLLLSHPRTTPSVRFRLWFFILTDIYTITIIFIITIMAETGIMANVTGDHGIDYLRNIIRPDQGHTDGTAMTAVIVMIK
jgi:hypothetical protein